jgi:uncharacterized protein YndB with AHSA1/START domain
MNPQRRIEPATCDVTVSRVFDAPRALVFRTWTEPRHLAQWWGPRGFTNPVCELDFRVGGPILVHTHAPDGRVFLMKGTVREFIAPARIVLAAVATDGAGNPLIEGLITATFEEQDGRTKVTVREQAVALASAGEPMIARMEVSWIESLGRIEGVVSPTG